MKQSRMVMLFSLMCAIIASSNATTLFSDDFQDPVASKQKWIFDSCVASTYSNGTVTLRNDDDTYIRFARTNLGTKSPTFTLSATITYNGSQTSGVGLACCQKDNDCIVVELGTRQNLLVYKLGAEIKEVLNVFNSFINKTSNVLTISKQDSTFNFFCNNNCIGTAFVSDPAFIAGGDISLFFSPKSSAVFDNVVMTDDYVPSSVRTCFSDDFNDAGTDGWYTYAINGTVQSGNGQLSVVNTDAQLSGIPLVNGDFSRSSLKAITSFKSGKGVYGCMFVYTTRTESGNTYKTYSFLIDSTQRYGIGNPDSSMLKMNVPKTFVHGATGSGKDTLEVLRCSNRYVFIINGDTAEKALSVPAKAPDGAGLYIGPNTSVAFDMFAVGGDSTGASCPVVVASGYQHNRFLPLLRFPANSLMAIDALGRINKRFDGNFSKAMQRGAAGVYFLTPVSEEKNTPVKMLRIIK